MVKVDYTHLENIESIFKHGCLVKTVLRDKLRRDCAHLGYIRLHQSGYISLATK